MHIGSKFVSLPGPLRDEILDRLIKLDESFQKLVDSHDWSIRDVMEFIEVSLAMTRRTIESRKPT